MNANAPTEVLGRRIAAGIIDLVVAVVLLILVGIVFKQSHAGHGQAAVRLHGLSFWIWLLVMLGYYGIPEAISGQTLGKKLLGIRVVSAEGGERPGGGRILVRTLMRLIDGFLFYLVAFIVILVTGKRAQRLGDLAARTTVTRARTHS